MDEVEIIRCEIPCAVYEREITALIELLLEIDEEMQKSENNQAGDELAIKAVAA